MGPRNGVPATRASRGALRGDDSRVKRAAIICRDHDPAGLVLGQDIQEAFPRAASGHPQGGQGSWRPRPADRIVRRQRQTRRAREGRQAEARAVQGSRGDAEAGRPGDGRLRQGDRRRRDLHADQHDQVVAPIHDPSASSLRKQGPIFQSRWLWVPATGSPRRKRRGVPLAGTTLI